MLDLNAYVKCNNACMSKGVARVNFFLPRHCMAEFQHVNCMIVRIWDRKSRELHAMLGLKLLLRQLPRLPQW